MNENEAMLYKEVYELNKKLEQLRADHEYVCRAFESSRDDNKSLDESNKNLISQIKILSENTVIEYCSHCDEEQSFTWDIETDGLHAFCPHCGNRLMLCSMCKATAGGMACDYDSQTDNCCMQNSELRR